ncbi:hypothetical protein [Mogibacterium pumilum]|uniref:Uncharacterized protein n=1 Tax=Mogibacterium pumilum TaxID=86332 RepID=A0A223ASA7_9FIRM|nr:hypothetical protein [Mogibacterium pumilum]ASS37799.1 hypothetical protein AXF17_04605 [Mogibacterium pumilum]
MKHVICPVFGNICIKYGKNKSGSQRWICKKCNERIGETMQYDNSFKQEAIELSDEIGVRKATEQLAFHITHLLIGDISESIKVLHIL